MKKSKAIVNLSLSIISIAIAAGLLWWAVDACSPPDKNKAERYFNQDKEDMVLITEYVIDSGYPVIYIRNAGGYMYVGHNKKIEDDIVAKAVDRLFEKRGYQGIEKSDNTISFLRWTRFTDFGSGIAYSINKENKPVLPYLTKLEPLSEDGWYYYEEDYNEWRLR